MDADAIVIGAGAAGLAAARSLAALSLRVIVLEARDRIGGRVLSRTMGRRTVPAELGAEFIHGPGQATRALLREGGSASIDSGGETWNHRAGELQRDNDEFASAPGIFEGSRELAHDESVAQFLKRFDTNPALRPTANAARAFVEGFEAADPALASARAIADEWRSGVDQTIARPLGGYRPMFEHLRGVCAAAGVHTSLSTIVRRISWRAGTVAVEVTSGWGELRTIRARVAVVTLPVGVLRDGARETRVVFDPGLPASKDAALRSIEMGQVVKVVLLFRRPFWAEVHAARYADGAFFRSEGHPFAAYWTQLPVRSELVVAWAGGPKAVALRDASATEIVGQALTGFGSLFGEPALARKEFEGGAIHDWAHDPFARGAYSYVAVGGGEARAALAAPVDGTLFFAGEATSTNGQGGTVNGALETGERAAREAATSLGALANGSRTFAEHPSAERS